MRKWSYKTTRNFFLMVEAVLVFIVVFAGGKSVVSMACYWGLVAFYHLMDFAFEAAKDSLEDKDGKHDD